MLPPEWLPTSSTGPSAGMLCRPADVGAEVEAREQPQPGSCLADVVGVALVEVGLGDPRLRHCATAASSARARGQPLGAWPRPLPVAARRSRWRRCFSVPVRSLPAVLRSSRSLRLWVGVAPAASVRGRDDLRPRRRMAVRAPDLVRLALRVGRGAAHGLRGRSCSATVRSRCRSPRGGARRHQVRPITSRSSASGWISSTSVPAERSFLASSRDAGRRTAPGRPRALGETRRACASRGRVEADTRSSPRPRACRGSTSTRGRRPRNGVRRS